MSEVRSLTNDEIIRELQRACTTAYERGRRAGREEVRAEAALSAKLKALRKAYRRLNDAHSLLVHQAEEMSVAYWHLRRTTDACATCKAPVYVVRQAHSAALPPQEPKS